MKSCLLGAVCVFLVVSSGTAHSVTFTGLGDSFAAISPDGSFVFNSHSRWTATGGWETWDSYSGGSLKGGVSAVSFDGSVVAGTLNDTPYRWTTSTGIVGIGSLPTSDSFSVSAISADGSVVVGTGTDTNPNNYDSQAFRWTPTTGMVGLGSVTNGSPESSATNVSADGSVVLGTDLNIIGSGYWAADGSWTNIASALTRPTAASADGSVIVGDQNGRSVFRWTAEEEFQDLGINTFRQYANGISSDGSIIVGQASTLAADSQNGAWIWDETNGARSIQDMLIVLGIDLTGWDLWAAESISADGSAIVGWGNGPSGHREAWIADFSVVPIPPALWLFGSGLLGLIGMAKCKQALS